MVTICYKAIGRVYIVASLLCLVAQKPVVSGKEQVRQHLTMEECQADDSDHRHSQIPLNLEMLRLAPYKTIHYKIITYICANLLY